MDFMEPVAFKLEHPTEVRHHITITGHEFMLDFVVIISLTVAIPAQGPATEN
jgi:hypothetical protein